MIMLYINACKIDMFNSIDLDQSAPQFSLILACNIFLFFVFVGSPYILKDLFSDYDRALNY